MHPHCRTIVGHDDYCSLLDVYSSMELLISLGQLKSLTMMLCPQLISFSLALRDLLVPASVLQNCLKIQLIATTKSAYNVPTYHYFIKIRRDVIMAKLGYLVPLTVLYICV